MRVSLVMDETTLSAVGSTRDAADALLVMDEESFRAFYERTARSVWAYLSRVTGDRQLADDLLQEAYYRFYKLGARHENERHRRNSLFCIATNLARDAGRHRRFARIVPLPEDDGQNALHAENREGSLMLDGEPLTVERVKGAMRLMFAEHGCSAEEFIVAPGPQGAAGHEMGHGPIRFGEPVVFDLWPRDDASSCFADMTRTVSVGPPVGEVREWHRLTREALDATTALIRAGVECHAVFEAACEVYEAAGYPTQRTKAAGEVLDRGFFHGLGHGVGLEVHEAPYMGRLPGGRLVAGDVVTLEPGLYDPAVGGVRLEDLVLVTEDGCEVLTRFPYDLEV